MDLLGIGQKWLHSTLPKTAAGEINYIVPDVGSVTVPAVRAQRTHQVNTSLGVTLNLKSPDWIISKALLVIDSVPVTPETGHLISADGQLYEVCMVGNGEPAARDSDRYGQAWRIHSQHMGID